MKGEYELTDLVIGVCLRIHELLGPGLFESVYESILCHELKNLGIQFTCQEAIPVVYKGEKIGLGFRADLIVEHCLLLEIKAVEVLAPIHLTQLRTYLALTNIPTGLLINFNSVLLKNGIRRIQNKSFRSAR